MSISKFVAKVQIIWELANFRKSGSASRTGDCETSGSASRTGDCETSESASRTGDYGTGETGGTGGTGGTDETGRNEDIFSSFGRVNSYLYFGDCSFIVR